MERKQKHKSAASRAREQKHKKQKSSREQSAANKSTRAPRAERLVDVRRDRDEQEP